MFHLSLPWAKTTCVTAKAARDVGCVTLAAPRLASNGCPSGARRLPVTVTLAQHGQPRMASYACWGTNPSPLARDSHMLSSSSDKRESAIIGVALARVASSALSAKHTGSR